MASQQIKNLKIEDLKLWTENPRDPMDNGLTDLEIIARALEDKFDKWKLSTLAKQMGEVYDQSELPTVIRINEEYLVVDGNRRVAILKYLKNPSYFTEYKKLKFSENTQQLSNMSLIPCNLCDKETALNNVERKHTQNGSWKPLEREWFQHLHRKMDKGAFIKFDEATGLISKFPKMNQGFVKDELLIKENLNKLGFNYTPEKGYTTNYSEDTARKILGNLAELVESKTISTRKNRGEILEPLQKNYPELRNQVQPYDSKKKENVLNPIPERKSSEAIATLPRKTPVREKKKELFGRTLILKPGMVNNLYTAIRNIHEKNRNDPNVLPLLAMSLRLLLETAARVHMYNDPGLLKDQIYNSFMKIAAKDMKDPKDKPKRNFLSLTEGWLKKDSNMDGILHKFAHGSIQITEHDLYENSYIVGDIVEFYFGKTA